MKYFKLHFKNNLKSTHNTALRDANINSTDSDN